MNTPVKCVKPTALIKSVTWGADLLNTDKGIVHKKKQKQRIGANRYLKGFYKRTITIYISLLILKRRFFRQSSPQHSQCFEFYHNYQRRTSYWPDDVPVNILCKSIAGRYRPVRVADGPITARYRFIKNVSWGLCLQMIMLRTKATIHSAAPI